jgi:crotonobetainyl-CoA:carnitine CoA-transferase CaiB-like acyl-CoA transferase
MGNAHSNMMPYQVFQCRLGDIIVAVGNDTQYAAFCRAIECPSLAADSRFSTADQRNCNRAESIPQVTETLLARTMDEWIPLLEASNVPCGPIYNIEQVFECPQVKHRQMPLSLPHGAGVDAPGVANPIRMSDTPIRHQRSAPMLGEHNDFVLRERLGLSADQISELKANGII